MPRRRVKAPNQGERRSARIASLRNQNVSDAPFVVPNEIVVVAPVEAADRIPVAAAPLPLPIRLAAPPGAREEIVDGIKAFQHVWRWMGQLSEHRDNVKAATNDDASRGNLRHLILCDRISLSGKAYTVEAANIIASFLQAPLFDDLPPLAQGIIEADLSDVIAGRMTDEGVVILKILCGAFATSNLVHVDLSENAIGEQGVGACKSVLTKSLTRLTFGNSGLADKTMARIADILTKDDDGSGCIASKLTKLHFFRNMSGVEGCKDFKRILEKCTKIEDLRYAGNRPLTAGSDVIASALDRSLGDGYNPNLRKLDLHDSHFSSKASHEALFRALGAATSLSHLDLGRCEMEDEGVKKICHALLACRSGLEFLDLSGNELTRHGAKHIADYIRDCGGKLKTLRLEDNELMDKGVVSIASAFRGSEDGYSIVELQLNNCAVGAIGARSLVDTFGPNGKVLPTLNHIFLNGNFFADDVLSELEVAFDFRLGDLDENVHDGDAENDLSDDEEEADEEITEEEQDEARVPESVDDLADAMEKSMLV